MIREAWHALLERASRLRSQDPETRARAWLAAVAVVAAAAVLGTLYGAAVEHFAARDACAEACAPHAPALIQGTCYCDPTKEIP